MCHLVDVPHVMVNWMSEMMVSVNLNATCCARWKYALVPHVQGPINGGMC
jgi:hypothetical protein